MEVCFKTNILTRLKPIIIYTQKIISVFELATAALKMGLRYRPKATQSWRIQRVAERSDEYKHNKHIQRESRRG